MAGNFLSAPIDSKYVYGGGAYVYIGQTRKSLTNVGFIKEFSVETASESNEENFINGTLKKVIDSNKVTVSLGMVEQRPELLEILFKGLVQRTTLTGATLTGYTETIKSGERSTNAGTAGKVVLLELQNASKLVVTNVVVTSSVDGALVAGTDYTVQVNGNGSSSIEFLSGGAITTMNQDISVTYDVTPTAGDIIRYDKSCGIAQPFVLEICATYTECATGAEHTVSRKYENCTAAVAQVEVKGYKETDTPVRNLEITGYMVSEVL